MAFMEPQLDGKCEWAEIETDNGTWYVPADVDDFRSRGRKERALQYTEGSTVHSVKIRKGYGVRLSAAGYMDCTEWDFYTNYRAARRAFRDLAEECEDNG